MVKVEILEQKLYHFLWIDDELWMWDVPEEIKDQKEMADAAFGNVLVAGYGLGLVQKYMTKNNDVNSVLTVELYKEVIEECKKIYGKIYGDVKIHDFYNYQTSKKFDCIIGDVWLDQSSRHIDNFTKFKAKSKTLLKEGGKILGWGMEYFEYLLKNEKHK